MSTVAAVRRQESSSSKTSTSAPHKAPLGLAGRLLVQFEEDLRAGDNHRAQQVNVALLELQQLMTPAQVHIIEQGIADAWRRACGWDF